MALELPTILVISENPPIRHWVKKNLESKFFVIDAANEKKALETVMSAYLDFVIVDASFEDHLELCRKIRKSNPTCAILLITGRLNKSYRKEATEAGVSDFLSDHLDTEELAAKIAVGKKATKVRQKVSGLSSLIATPKSENASLKNRALQFLAESKTPVTLIVVQIDRVTKHDKATLAAFSELMQQEAALPSEEGQFVILISNGDAPEVAKELQRKIHARFQDKLTASFVISKVENNELSFNKTVQTATAALKKTSNRVISLDQELLG